MSEPPNVIITGETEKLPTDYATLLDVQKTLPANVAFFEKRFTLQDMLKAIMFAVVFAIIGLLALLFGIAEIGDVSPQGDSGIFFGTLAFGAVLLFASWIFAGSLRRCWSLMRLQQAGGSTRLGIFLDSQSLFEATELGYCIVPRMHFRGLAAGSVRYEYNGAEKSFRLPQSLMNSDIGALTMAIEQWAGAAPNP